LLLAETRSLLRNTLLLGDAALLFFLSSLLFLKSTLFGLESFLLETLLFRQTYKNV